ncbi:ABC transporter substrate-binding protein [Staphylothermus hellenicus]|uniref:Extracellular solute-binding protein family 5 n=1 Tax=Staphylothermus hellenicus (strain DSM 12710 / JCM 10830 / BK20S6-10-b1 / P8) TaxID=591019 RepID=D7D865_STAHD|nr:ABC transporter substrate-binding protein [Staphylothermus hellenicus]ADI31961.1 extracellular solute-binding protein family 5 [Staphylothermus hellenicus DSM 12710]
MYTYRLKAISKTAWTIIIIFLIIIGAVAVWYSSTWGKPAETATTTTSSPTTSSTTSLPATTSATSPAVKQIVIGVTDKVTDLDPSNAYDFFTWEVLNNIMEGLVKYKPGTLDIVPGLAESWEVSDDSKTWTFHLRSGLKFADGTPLTAQDVVRSINRVMRINGDPAWLVTSFVESVEAPDNLTVVFHLKQPTAYFLALLATPPYFPVHPAYKPDEIDSDQTAGGAGPYKITKFIRDDVLVLETNPYYYGDKPKTSKIVIKFFRDATSLRLAIENGEIDIAWRTLRPTDIDYFKKASGYKVIEVPGSFIRYICINTKMSPVDNKLVRQALAAAINRQDIIDTVLLGAGEPLYSLVPNGMWSHIDVFKEKYGNANIDLAKQLLQKAGYSEENKLHIELWYTPTHYGDTEADIAQVIKEQWEATGMITVDIKSAEWGTYVDYIRNNQLMVYLLGWYPDYLDPDDYLTPFLHSESNSWAGTQYANATVDQLLVKAQTITDQNQRAQLYKQVQEIFAEDVPYIPIFQGKLYIIAREGVEGIIPNPTMLLLYSTIYKS